MRAESDLAWSDSRARALEPVSDNTELVPVAGASADSPLGEALVLGGRGVAALAGTTLGEQVLALERYLSVVQNTLALGGTDATRRSALDRYAEAVVQSSAPFPLGIFVPSRSAPISTVVFRVYHTE